MIRVLGIGGEPGSGKTSIVREIVKKLGFPNGWKFFGAGTMRWHHCEKHKLSVLGVYDKSTFAGTDRLSMAAQPDAIKIMTGWAADLASTGYGVLFEGDRLFNQSFLSALQKQPGIDTSWLVLMAAKEEIDRRHKARKDTQTATWLKGRVSKIKNLLANKEFRIHQLPNNDGHDKEGVVKWVIEELGIKL